jgi:hypothetical protein
MKVYVVNYALEAAFEAEMDDPSTADGGIDGFASPQFAAVLPGRPDGHPEGDGPDGAALSRVMTAAEMEHLSDVESLDFDSDAAPVLSWRLRESSRGPGRDCWAWDLLDGDDAVGTLVVQATELYEEV